jgi:hypothetical protein
MCRYGILQNSSGDADAPLITHARHRAHLESAFGFLDAFLVMRGASFFKLSSSVTDETFIIQILTKSFWAQKSYGMLPRLWARSRA